MKPMFSCLTFVVIISLISVVHNEKILFFSYFPSSSHQKVFTSIWKALSLRGHQVTAIGSNPLKDPNLTNLTEIDTKNTYQVFKTNDISNLRIDVASATQIDRVFMSAANEALDLIMKNEQVEELMRKPSDYFDLVIFECHLPTLYGIQHKFNKAPSIAISSLGAISAIFNYHGSPIHPILYPDTFASVAGESWEKMSLIDKMESVWVTLSLWFEYNFNHGPSSDRIAREYFGGDMPYIDVLLKNVSLLLLNLNPLFTGGRPNPPNVVEYYNIHLSDKGKIPGDLEQILNKSTDGVVYFSLGTNVRFDHVEGNVKETFLRALGALNYTVFCKWESDDYQGGPKNVIFRKWFPQQAVLAHPNIKVFVTQGGLQSAEEAISNGVPLVVIPFLGDQPMNAKILTNHGMAETIPPKTLTEELLRDTINKVATEEKYRNRAKELRNIFLDQPQSGIDKIIWWCEYVIRHKGAKHLRSPGADIPLYEYFMLDVLAVILICCFVVFIALRSILRMAFALFLKSGKPKKD